MRQETAKFMAPMRIASLLTELAFVREDTSLTYDEHSHGAEVYLL